MADKKITALTATTSVVAADLFPIVTDTTGTATTKKITAANLATYTSTGLATLASPTFTGTPTLPTGTIAVTQSGSDNSTKVATTAYVDAAAPTVNFSSDQNILNNAVFS